MRVAMLRLGGNGLARREDFSCTHVMVGDGVLRLERRPNSQQRGVGMHTVEHVISIPLERIVDWKEYES